MAEKHGKIWGTTQCIMKGHNWEVHRIEIKAGGYCSKHTHNHKNNMFFVEHGMLEVEKYDNGLTDTTILINGESTTVKPGIKHMFRAKSEVIAYEIYWLDSISEDITRFTQGGMDDK